MYSSSFYIDTPVWNNVFSYEKRENKRLFVANLKKIQSLEEIELWKEIVFEEDDGDGIIKWYTWLKNFYELDNIGEIKTKIYIFDNHNHAYFFWHKSRFEWVLENEATLFHIDEHADMRSPDTFLSQSELGNVNSIFNYTNFTLNVGNYIIPAEKDGLVKKTYQIRTETALLDILNMPVLTHNNILNIDLDFFHPDLDFIPFALKKEVILKLAKNAKLITIASSPYFINQELAIKVLKNIFI